MAATAAGAALTEGHRLAQVRIAAETVRAVRATWPLLDPTNIDATLDRWLRATVPLVQRQARRSAALSGEYLRSFRAVELSISDYEPLIAQPASPTRIAASLTVTGPVAIKQQMLRLVALDEAVQTAESMAVGSAMRHALNGGRDTISRSVEADQAAHGLARVTSLDPCWFCAMLASRGPAYKHDSFSQSDPRFTGPGDHKVHDNCGCSLEPIYHRDAAWPGRSREFESLWLTTAKGLAPNEARRAFRQAYEERSPSS